MLNMGNGGIVGYSQKRPKHHYRILLHDKKMMNITIYYGIYQLSIFIWIWILINEWQKRECKNENGSNFEP